MVEHPGNGSPHEDLRLPSEIDGEGCFRLRLLGPFELTDPSGRQVDVGSRKNRLLLAMLALAPGRSISRDALASALWGENGEPQARSSLRQALAALRKDLNGHEDSFLDALDGSVALDPVRVVIDTDLFLADATGSTREPLERAAGLWRGPFLADVSAPEPDLEQWLGERREFFASRYIAALDRLVPLLQGAQRIDMAKQLVQADSLREGSHRQLMEAYLAAGERAQALRHYDKIGKLLADELGVAPAPETQALRSQMLASEYGMASVPSAGEAAPTDPSDVLPAGAAHAAAAPQPAEATVGSHRPLASVFALLALLATVAAAFWFFNRPPPAVAAAPSIAVLPFESLSDDPNDARFAEGLTIDTISDLSRFWDIRVMAKDTTDAYKGKNVDIRALGKDLKVSHVLEGTFRRDQDHIRITAELIDASTGRTLWADRYDRMIGEIFAVQSDVADHIANSLGGKEGKVGESVLAGARRKPPSDLDAYELYLLAQQLMHSDLSDEHMKEGQKILDQAIAKDPTFARAYVKYAHAYAWRFTYEGGAAELMRQAVSYARKAVSLDPMDADARAALGYGLTLTGDPKQGEAQFDEALRLNPGAFDILDTYACMAHSYGKADKGAEAADRAIAINPLYPKWSIPCLRLGLVMVGRYEDVIRVQSRQPEDEWNTDGFVTVAGSLASLGRMNEAKALAARGVAKYPGLLSIERFALNRGWPPEASKVMVDLMRRAGFPPCATAQDLADTPNPVRLPECTG
jgi:TolB-like protein/DNA-binding SARP family transcriptional activator/Tfp pilus assembly protein PilF